MLHFCGCQILNCTGIHTGGGGRPGISPPPPPPKSIQYDIIWHDYNKIRLFKNVMYFIEVHIAYAWSFNCYLHQVFRVSLRGGYVEEFPPNLKPCMNPCCTLYTCRYLYLPYIRKFSLLKFVRGWHQPRKFNTKIFFNNE